MATRYTIGVRIEGIGSDTSKSGGVAWYWGNDISSAQNAASDYEWVGGYGSATGLASAPLTLDSSVDPFTADVRSSSYRFELHFGVVERLLFTASPPTTAEYVNEGLSDSETGVILSSGYTASNDGEVVYIADEAILLGSLTGSEFTGCTRGYWGTTAQPAPKYTAAFSRNPYVGGRRVTVIRFDHADDSETVIWTGFLDDWEGSEDGTRITLTCRETLAVLQDAQVNLASPDHSKLRGAASQGATGKSIRLVKGYLTRYIAPAPSRRVRTKTTATHWAAFQIGSGLFFGRWDTGASRYMFEDASTDPEGSLPQLGSPMPEPGEFEPIHEVLAIVRARDKGNGTTAALTARRSASAELSYPFHPLAVSLALFLSSYRDAVSGYDVWGPEWGLGAAPDLFDLTDIGETIAATAGLEIDQLLLGWDGEPVTPWEVLVMLCRIYGLFPVPRSNGAVSVRQFRDAAVDDVATAASVTTIPYTLHWMPRRGDSVDVLSGRFGALPWDEGTPYKIQQVDRRGDVPVPRTSRRSGFQASLRETSLDMPTRSNVSELGQTLLGMAVTRAVAAPRLRITAIDEDFGLGDFVRVVVDTRDPWLPDEDGVAYVPAANSAKNVGLVLGMRRNLEEGTADIEVMLLNRDGRYARLRAPSAVMAGTGTAPTYNVSTTASDQFVTSTSGDEDTFTVGDKCEVWQPDGTRRSGTRAAPDMQTITSIGANSITFDSAFDTAPSAGDILRLAHLDDTDGSLQTGNPSKYDGFRAYAYLADDSNQVSPDDEDGDIYGTGGA